MASQRNLPSCPAQAAGTTPPVASTGKGDLEGQGFLPWCAWRSQDVSPHPGRLGPVPRGAGTGGYLRTPDRGHLMDCDNDLEAVSRWLARQKDNAHTLDAYRREIERYLLWLGLERGKALSEATGEDITLYDDLLQAPQRWAHWYGQDRVSRNDPRWRPFTRALSPRSRHAALQVVHRCYRWLVEQGYLRLNPVTASSVKLRTPRGRRIQDRYLDETTWQAVLAHIQAMPQENDFDLARYHRARWVISALYILLARSSELTEAKMGDLIQIRRPQGVQWWWQVRGKHRRPEDPMDEIPVPSALMDELRLYRESLGLPRNPPPGDPTPMILSLYPRRDGWKPMNRSTLFRQVKGLFRGAADALEDADPETAARLREASPHWLRHTGITHRLDEGWGLKDAQRLSRHLSLKDLGTYAHSDRDALHQRAEKIRIFFRVSGLRDRFDTLPRL